MTAALSPAARRSFPLFIAGLSLKQILAWGTTYYLPSILEGSIARELGLGRGVIFGGVTLMLLVAAVIAPRAGRHIDAHGVRGPMLLGSLSLSAGLCLLGLAQGPVSYLAGWVLFGVAVPLTMSIAAFAAVAQAFPERGRSGITVLMLFGGLSSGVMWPLTGWLDAELGWRTTCFVYAALQIGVALPVAHWLVVDTRKAGSASEAARHAIQPRLPEEARSKGFALLVIGSGVSGLVSWGLPLYFVPMFREAGLTAGLAILLASLQAYFTLSARLFDLAVSARPGRDAPGLHRLADQPGGLRAAALGRDGVVPAGPAGDPHRRRRRHLRLRRRHDLAGPRHAAARALRLGRLRHHARPAQPLAQPDVRLLAAALRLHL